MEETEELRGLQSSKKFWLWTTVCAIGLALLLFALRGYPEESLTYIALKNSGLFLLGVGLFFLIVGFAPHRKHETEVYRSVLDDIHDEK